MDFDSVSRNSPISKREIGKGSDKRLCVVDRAEIHGSRARPDARRRMASVLACTKVLPQPGVYFIGQLSEPVRRDRELDSNREG